MYITYIAVLLCHSSGHATCLFIIPQTHPSFTLNVFLVVMSVALSAEFQCLRRQQR